MTGYESKRAMAQDKLAQPEFIKHEVENADDWSEWVCPDPTSEQLHLDASAYANKRIAMHKEAIKQQKQTPLDDKVHNGTWIAHYEGYVAGYEAQRPWVYLTDEHIKEIVGPYALPIIGYTRKLFDQIEAKSKELNT